MAHKIIATVTNDDLGLEEENEIIGVNDELKEILVSLGYAKFYDNTKPRVGKSVNVYESGKSYPKNRQVFKNDSIYISTQNTSTTWVYNGNPALSEWKILVTGSNAQ